MKICICTTPIRPEPTMFPPLGSLSIIQSLRQVGEDVEFYNIDYFRPSQDKIETFFKENQFDVVGISAVVSTAYAYTRDLARLIREISPDTFILVGGNLAASAEVILRKCEVDFCVVGDGELIIRNLIDVLYEKPVNYDRLSGTLGICFLDEDGKFRFTGYGTPLPADELEWPNYDILEADGSLPYFISSENPWDHGVIHETEGKRWTTVITAKGCVARCTFCHRWERGYRARPADQFQEHFRFLRDRYDVGFISIGDENFGSDRKKARAIAECLQDLGIFWRAAGVRARSVDPEMLGYWRANGCRGVYFGIESGSQKMLDIMEKNTTVQMNIDALRWTYEAGLFTIVQLVIGMPGETDQTVRETIEFLKGITPYLYIKKGFPHSLISINYAQALPGTPLYEYARENGFIGTCLEEEETYLLKISDTDAYATDHFVNYTGQPLLKVLLWREWIVAEVDAHYALHTLGISLSIHQIVVYFAKLGFHTVAKRLPAGLAQFLPKCPWSLEQIFRQLMNETGSSDKSGYFNVKPSFFAPLLFHTLTRRYFYPLLAISMSIVSADSPGHAFRLLADHVRWSLARWLGMRTHLPDESLRKVVTIEQSEDYEEDAMIPLRLGR